MDVNNVAAAKTSARRAVLGVGVACVAFLVSALATAGLPYFDDELGYYIPQALRVLDGPNSWQVALGGYFGHPPLLELSLVAFWKLAGYTVGGTRVLLALLGAATLALTGASALRWRGHRPAVGASVLLASSPLFYFHSQSAIPEVLVTLCVTTALWAVMSGRVVTLVAALSAAALAKPTALVIVPPIALYMIMQSRRRQRAVDRSSLLAVIAIPMALTLGWMAAWAVTPSVEGLVNPTGLRNVLIVSAVAQLLDPYRIAVFWAIRTLQLGYFDFRWLATALILLLSAWVAFGWRRTRTVRDAIRQNAPELTLFAMVVGLYIGVHGIVGDPPLPRYLLPCLPAFSILTAVALDACGRRFYWPALTGLAVCYLSAMGGPSYQLGRFHMGTWNDHATYRPMVRAYQESFAFVENRCPTAVIAGNYPATTMARDPRLGYVRAPHRSEPLAAQAPDAAGGRPVYVVAGDQLSPVPDWVRNGSTGRRWTFGEDRSTVWVIGPAGSSPCP